MKLAAIFFLLLGALPAAAEPAADAGEGSLQVGGAEGVRLLPLKRTAVNAEVAAFAAEVEVTQYFANPSTGPIEAVYVFPLPENAAVTELTLTVADRVIKGKIKKRAEARQVYEEARAEGKTAALLDQERPNVFTQSVANIPPGSEIRVSLKYLQDLAYDRAEYRFHFPMTVGPRYIPGRAAGKAGTGWSPDTDRVPDASRVTPPVVRPGERSGRDIELTVTLSPGSAIRNLRSGSHETDIADLGNGRWRVSLAAGDRIPNKDFLLSWEPAARILDAASLAHRDGGDGYLTLMLQPGAEFPLSNISPKELVFALDVSGSMSGFPVETAKEIALRCLDGMSPEDTFQILSFAGESKLHFSAPLPNNAVNRARGRAVLAALGEGGGTEMLEGLRAALEAPRDPARLRIVVLMTDGYIGNESEIINFVAARLNGARVFPLGVGSSVNRYLLEELAAAGRGEAQYLRHDDKPAKIEKVIEGFYDRIARPLLTDLSVDWNGLDVRDAVPGVITDLFAGQPVGIHARYGRPGAAPVYLKGKMLGKPWKMTVNLSLPEKEAGNAGLPRLWARSKILDLERRNYGRAGEGPNKEEITALALEYGLMSQYTSFVAVDESTRVAGRALLVPVEAELPEGTRYEGFFGGRGGAAVAATRGSLGQAKFAMKASNAIARLKSMAAPSGSSAMSLGFASRSGGVLHDQGWTDNGDGKPTAQRSLTADLARGLLAAPSARDLRKLLALQGADGWFAEKNTKVTEADQALALLALARAAESLGADASPALGKAWLALSAGRPGLDGRQAALKALEGSRHWTAPGVQYELGRLRPSLEALK